jgi:tetratricopeptide (TPR) repeat protein
VKKKLRLNICSYQVLTLLEAKLTQCRITNHKKYILLNDRGGFSTIRVLSHLRRYEEAIRCLDNAIKLNPNYGEAYYHKGLALDKLGKKNDAETSFKKAKELGYKP